VSDEEKTGGFTVFICGRPRPEPCASCGAPSVSVCGFELKGKAAGRRCGRAVCERCGVLVAGDDYLCGPHHRIKEPK
jgi:hypothetical protein